MAHHFDSGFSEPQRTRIQHGAVALLSPLKRSEGGYLIEVAPFGAVITNAEDDQGAAQLISALSRMPSVAVALGDRTSDVRGMGGYIEDGELDLIVYLSSSNARNNQVGRMEIDGAGLASDLADPGLHVMMDHVKELLLGQRIDSGTDIKQIRPYREEGLYSSSAMTVWRQTYRISVQIRVSEWRTVTQLLNSLRFRAATEADEVHLPAPATKTATIDVNTDL